MSQPMLQPLQRRRLSLSLRVSLGLVLAALIPLVITLLFSEWQTRPALTAQASTSMENDASARVQLIDTYLHERLLDAETLGQVPSVQEFLSAPPAPNSPTYQELALHASYALVAGKFRDKNYAVWVLFNAKGDPLLQYPSPTQSLTSISLDSHGQYLIPPEEKTQVLAGKTFISPVYYTPSTQKASVEIYSPIIVQQTAQGKLEKPLFLGFMRATLNLDYIWTIVQGEQGNNGPGSYAFILDENGVRIADTDPDRRFKAVAPLPSDLNERMSNEARYGTTAPVSLLADEGIADNTKNSSSPASFRTQPAGQSEQFQVVQHKASAVPWRYFVLSPVSTVTSLANQQLFVTLLVALGTSLLVALFGLIVGRSVTRPILQSVEYLRNNSLALSTLATQQQDAASEQMWVVDSSQVGLQSVQYYTDATRVAAYELNMLGTELLQHWHEVDPRQAQQVVDRMVMASRYIEEATQYQGTSNQKLSTALKVATQVSEQLASGATSATSAADQLEQVVAQLRSVVGK